MCHILLCQETTVHDVPRYRLKWLGSVCLQDSSVVKYHVIPNVLLYPDHLWDGMLKSTMLGVDYQVQFHLNSKNQVKKTKQGH